ncbi:hypothetical protein JXC34_01435 [Candidatus Woesearchaeota archaeon]|nr:hypothetical protein [Candidatus Woesearchaeota archaeon]
MSLIDDLRFFPDIKNYLQETYEAKMPSYDPSKLDVASLFNDPWFQSIYQDVESAWNIQLCVTDPRKIEDRLISQLSATKDDTEISWKYASFQYWLLGYDATEIANKTGVGADYVKAFWDTICISRSLGETYEYVEDIGKDDCLGDYKITSYKNGRIILEDSTDLPATYLDVFETLTSHFSLLPNFVSPQLYSLVHTDLISRLGDINGRRLYEIGCGLPYYLSFVEGNGAITSACDLGEIRYFFPNLFSDFDISYMPANEDLTRRDKQYDAIFSVQVMRTDVGIDVPQTVAKAAEYSPLQIHVVSKDEGPAIDNFFIPGATVTENLFKTFGGRMITVET